MEGEKVTLDQLIPRKPVKLELTAEMAAHLYRFFVETQVILRTIAPRRSQYEVGKVIVLLDLALHRAGLTCDVDQEGCALNQTLENFRREYALELKADPDYSEKDFIIYKK